MNADLSDAQIQEFVDKEDRTVKGRFYFGGIESGKVQSLKKGLRGIYVRINGRLLKQSFTEQHYVYNISKWVKFAAGLRVELSVDWLRNEISLSREGIRFSNRKLEEQFRAVLTRLVSRFIQPQLKKLEKKAAREAVRSTSNAWNWLRNVLTTTHRLSSLDPPMDSSLSPRRMANSLWYLRRNTS